jgi:hypothetical protein
MISLLSEPDRTVKSPAPFPAYIPKLKPQPVPRAIALGASTVGQVQAAAPVAAQTAPRPAQPVIAPSATPMAAAVSAPPVQPAAAPKQNIRSTIFSAEGRPASPWTGGGARVAPKPPVTPKADLGMQSDLPEADGGIEGVRKLLFGRHLTEIQTKVAEMQMSLNGEMKRLREAVMNRVDEMAGYLHRDMLVLREEMLAELGQVKNDLFTAATGMSGLRDRLLVVETKDRAETIAKLTDIDSRLTRQQSAFEAALDKIDIRLNEAVGAKCAEALVDLTTKSDIAQILSQMGTLVAQATPSVELGWLSAAPAEASAAPSGFAELESAVAPEHPAAPEALVLPEPAETATVDAPAIDGAAEFSTAPLPIEDNLSSIGDASDWAAAVNTCPPDEMVIA